jgi:hypothetical protein
MNTVSECLFSVFALALAAFVGPFLMFDEGGRGLGFFRWNYFDGAVGVKIRGYKLVITCFKKSYIGFIYIFIYLLLTYILGND